MSTTMHTVLSADGTTIGYRRTGTGPALVVVPGNNRMAHNYDRMVAELSDAFTVCVIERRGRGTSGPQGPDYAIEREVEDLHAVAEEAKARLVFGHSYGGLVTLTAAQSSSEFDRVAVYEPGVSIDGSFDLSFRTEFEQLLARGKHVRAMALFFHATRLIRLPYPLMYLLGALMVGRPGEMRDLMATTPAELREVARADSDGSPFASIAADTLLVGGTTSPPYLLEVLEPLGLVIPHASHATVAGADHNAPDESAPTRVARVLRDFFARLESEDVYPRSAQEKAGFHERAFPD